MKINSHRDLIVWQKSIRLVLDVYDLTDEFPKDERFGLISQLRRASVSIPSNIAEGTMRSTRKDYAHFIDNALGSAAEVDTQLYIAEKLKFGNPDDLKKLLELNIEIMKMLNKLSSRLKNRS